MFVGGSEVVRKAILSSYRSKTTLTDECGASSATHAVIFSDAFSDKPHLPNLDSSKIRHVYTPISRVVNIKRLPEGFNAELMTYVGRGTPFGNPHPLQETGSRDKSIDYYKYDFERGFLGNGDTKELAIKDLLGRFLGCSCKPLRCHGDVLADFLNSVDIDEIDAELKKQSWFYQFGITIGGGSNVRE